ncbi:T9SS type A sorting domain-containing protein [Flavobacterium stagni]|uniref:T9SS type A sorting domain-containing protein n=1 Tax=Flavobacterium stagni TaxID=2506421 RepID=A0A4Q1K8S4_9FLAO|nr:T9SS type A sorting domain-containing protein [Flavobacterium stagni]RXR22166.1 T9SS type A sorting domain-containing protein [Flavobacterium stagni]
MKTLVHTFFFLWTTWIFAQPPVVTPGAAGIAKPTGFTVLNGKMIFAGMSSTSGRELFVYDGNTTTLLKEISFSGTFIGSSALDVAMEDPVEFRDRTCIFNNKLYFPASDNPFNQTANSLWCTDGTTAGTVKVFDYTAAGCTNLKYLTVFNGKMYFVGSNINTAQEIWSSDGTLAGTSLLKDIYPGFNSAVSTQFNPNFKVFNGKLYFVANDGTTGYELYATDGTTAGTQKVVDLSNLYTTSERGAFYYGGNYLYFPFQIFNNRLWFTCRPNNTNATDYTNYALYSTDGTEAGTQIFTLPNPNTNSLFINHFALARGFTVANNALYFFARNRLVPTQQGIWKIDTAGNFTYLRAMETYLGDTGTSDTTVENTMREFNGSLYFQGSDGASNSNQAELVLWRLNPSDDSLSMIQGLQTNQVSHFDNSFGLGLVSIVYNNELYFVKTKTGFLSKTNGTAAGTVNVARQMPTTVNATLAMNTIPKELEVSNNSLFFRAAFQLGGTAELWMLTDPNLAVVNTSNGKFKVYPNPTQSYFTIDQLQEQVRVEVFSIEGRSVLQAQCDSQDASVDVSTLPAGVYIVQISTQEKQTSIQILKQ